MNEKEQEIIYKACLTKKEKDENRLSNVKEELQKFNSAPQGLTKQISKTDSDGIEIFNDGSKVLREEDIFFKGENGTAEVFEIKFKKLNLENDVLKKKATKVNIPEI